MRSFLILARWGGAEDRGGAARAGDPSVGVSENSDDVIAFHGPSQGQGAGWGFLTGRSGVWCVPSAFPCAHSSIALIFAALSQAPLNVRLALEPGRRYSGCLGSPESAPHRWAGGAARAPAPGVAGAS